jgi:hypothetical protein
MSNPWIVEPEDVKLDLEWTDPTGEVHSFWIKAKKVLSVGEQRGMLKNISKVTTQIGIKGAAAANPEAKFEWTEYSFARAETFLTDWSLANSDGNKLSLNREVLESLHQGLFEIIDDALDEHEKASTQEKKARTSSRKRKRTSG